MKRKRFFAGLLALALLAALLPVTAYAVGAQVMIYGKLLNSTTPYYLNGPDGGEGSTSNTDLNGWNAHYDPATGVLTLKDLNVVNSATEANDIKAIYAEGDLSLVLEGESRIEQSSRSTGMKGIETTKALQISGSGSLTIEGVDTGIMTGSTGIDGGPSFRLSGGSVLVDSTQNNGISTAYRQTVSIEDGTLTLSRIDETGINCGNMRMSGGTLNVNAIDKAIWFSDSFSITGGRADLYGDINGGVVSFSEDSSFNITGGYARIHSSEAAVLLGNTNATNPITATVPYTPAGATVQYFLDDDNHYYWTYAVGTLECTTWHDDEDNADYWDGFVNATKDITFSAASKKSGGKDTDKTTAYSEDDNVKVIVDNGDVAIKKLAAGDESYDLLLKAASGTPLMAYEIDATDGEDGARVMFYVGRENAGKQYTVLHRLADGSVEEFHVTCAANGWITVLVNSLSPFMVFEGNVKAAGTAVRVTSDENPDTGANDAVALAAALGTLALVGCCAVGKRCK